MLQYVSYSGWDNNSRLCEDENISNNENKENSLININFSQMNTRCGSWKLKNVSKGR